MSHTEYVAIYSKNKHFLLKRLGGLHFSLTRVGRSVFWRGTLFFQDFFMGYRIFW